MTAALAGHRSRHSRVFLSTGSAFARSMRTKPRLAKNFSAVVVIKVAEPEASGARDDLRIEAFTKAASTLGIGHDQRTEQSSGPDALETDRADDASAVDGDDEIAEMCVDVLVGQGGRLTFRPGDIQWLKNAVILHKRTAYEDYEEPDRKRHLIRLWLRAPDFVDGDAQLRGGVRLENAAAAVSSPTK